MVWQGPPAMLLTYLVVLPPVCCSGWPCRTRAARRCTAWRAPSACLLHSSASARPSLNLASSRHLPQQPHRAAGWRWSSCGCCRARLSGTRRCRRHARSPRQSWRPLQLGRISSWMCWLGRLTRSRRCSGGCCSCAKSRSSLASACSQAAGTARQRYLTLQACCLGCSPCLLTCALGHAHLAMPLSLAPRAAATPAWQRCCLACHCRPPRLQSLTSSQRAACCRM